MLPNDKVYIISKPIMIGVILLFIFSTVVVVYVARPFSNSTYRSCALAKAAGKHDIPKTDPTYNAHLDQNHNGIACETTR